MELHVRHSGTGEPLAITVENRRIVSVRPYAANPTAWVSPSFFDPQINGCLGIAFNSPTLRPEQVKTVADECLKHGIGGFCPTLITGSFEDLRHGFATLRQAVDSDEDLKLRLPGYHLEGPYLSSADGPRGAHPKEHIRDPNWDEFQLWQDAAGGRILMVTIAPEKPGAVPFIAKLATTGVVVAIGHTSATGEQIRAAVDAGARTCTHLGNGAHALLPRHPNYIWEQLAEDRLWASVISDGHHLSAAVLRSIVRAKGVNRTLITSDASSLAGSPPGKYHEWGTDLEVLPGGKVVLAGTPYLAGSGHFTDRCIGTMIEFAGVSLKEAVDMAAVRPRELLGLPVPRIEVNQPADLVVFDWQPGGAVVVRQTI